MKLGEVLERGKHAPRVGDHEIVVGPDGLAHLLVVTHVDLADPLQVHYNFESPCRAIKTGDPTDFVVAPSITCMQCMLL
jgi:hypothetical protein